jgi:hypothetical protein
LISDQAAAGCARGLRAELLGPVFKSGTEPRVDGLIASVPRLSSDHPESKEAGDVEAAGMA